ncbi:Mrp/NBP35 family ATP-binding protein [Desulfosarcina sp. OttesenSCG-928-A07]|nr:Mrp/NBP35 family ATP-binding protein [Desulfosarcina sp. OttesenSCG-928-G17]MDL2329608.1 Mrp/NBP35 family ATP-binding protein [Desulfosarcina sp. OttesenSCG-928-A07]
MQANSTEKKGCGEGQGGCAQGPDPQEQQIENALSRIKNKLIVMSGKGGVGKSSFSTNLSTCLASQGFETGLLDVDLHGPSIAGMLGITGLMMIDTENQQAIPQTIADLAHLKVVSMQSLMKDPDQAVIWRGPAKTRMIRQFISDVRWGDLDFLVVDSPPGTGDEPLAVTQAIPGAKALIVTTPQDVALADVRKSINFCRTVNIQILGLVENMGPFLCPCCGKPIALFKQGGGQATADAMGIRFLGTLPFDRRVVTACDTGKPIITHDPDSAFASALKTVVQNITDQL